MAEVNGCLTSCDRCGETIFRRVTGEGERDGGFTRWNKFEPLPEGWTHTFEIGLLCASCASEWSSIIEKFKQPPPKEQEAK